MGVYNTELQQGATFVRQFVLSNADGSPTDLTSATFAMMARTDYADASPVLSLSSTNGDFVVSGNMVTLTITETATLALGYTSTVELVYDVLMTIGSVVTRIVEGTLTVTPEATR